MWFNRLSLVDTLKTDSIIKKKVVSYDFYIDDIYVSSFQTSKWGDILLRRFEMEHLFDTECVERDFVEKFFLSRGTSIEGSICSRFRLHQNDLVPEGLDFHCDWNLIPSVLGRLTKSSLDSDILSNVDEDKLKHLIWIFRSSTNNHRFDESHHPDIRQHVKEQLTVKKTHSKEWAMICPLVTEYCCSKCEMFWQKYSRAVPALEIR